MRAYSLLIAPGIQLAESVDGMVVTTKESGSKLRHARPMHHSTGSWDMTALRSIWPWTRHASTFAATLKIPRSWKAPKAP